MAAASTPPTLYPISAIHFIDTEADIPQYLQLMQTYGQGLSTIEGLICDEETQFQTTLQRIQQLKEAAVKLVTREMDTVAQRLTTLHTSVAQKLINVKSDINIAKTDKEAKLGSTSQLLLDCKGQKAADFYAPLVGDLVTQIKMIIHSQDIPTDADHYFRDLFPRQEAPKHAEKQQECPAKQHPRPVDKIVPPQKRPRTERKCSLCREGLKEVFHQCTETNQCLDCFEKAVATACFGGRAACPKCGGVPLEVYRNRDMKECVYCSRKLRLTEVAHWCGNNSAILCEKCVARVWKDGKCIKCGHDITHRSDNSVK